MKGNPCAKIVWRSGWNLDILFRVNYSFLWVCVQVFTRGVVECSYGLAMGKGWGELIY